MKKHFNEIRVIQHVKTPSRDRSKLESVENAEEVQNGEVWYDIEFAYTNQPKNLVGFMFSYGDTEKSLTVNGDYVHTPKSAYQFLQALKHTELTGENMSGYVKGPLIIMDPKTHKVPYVKDETISYYEVLAAACDKFFKFEENQQDFDKVNRFMEKFVAICQEGAGIPENELNSKLSGN